VTNVTKETFLILSFIMPRKCHKKTHSVRTIQAIVLTKAAIFTSFNLDLFERFKWS